MRSEKERENMAHYDGMVESERWRAENNPPKSSRCGIEPFTTAREALTFMAEADGYVTVLNGNSDFTVRMEAWPHEAQRALDRMNDPWPADCVQPLR